MSKSYQVDRKGRALQAEKTCGRLEVGLMQSSWRMAPQYVWSSWCLASDVGQESDGPKAGRQDVCRAVCQRRGNDDRQLHQVVACLLTGWLVLGKSFYTSVFSSIQMRLILPTSGNYV